MSDVDANPEVDIDLRSESGSLFGLRETMSRVREFIETDVPAWFDGPDFFDNCEGGLASWRTDWYKHKSGKMLPFKGQPRAVPIEDRDRICMHITSCHFGTSSGQRRAWTKRMDAGKLSDELLASFGVDTLGTDAAAARMALHARFWKVPYHWVGLRNGDILYNNLPTSYTYHGNGANRRSIGVSAEAVLPGRERGRKSKHDAMSASFIETNRNVLRLAVVRSRAAGAPIDAITAHRCYSKTRQGDPGEAVWREIVKPVAQELELSIDYDFSQSSGRPIPSDWDDDAHSRY